MPEDIFTQLDRELEAMQGAISSERARYSEKKENIVKKLLENFWYIQQKFDHRRVHFTLEPVPMDFMITLDQPGAWKFREDYDFTGVSAISLADKTHIQGRLGDALTASFYSTEKDTHVRITFEYIEGEHYYKYSGWKQIYAQHILYDSPLEKANMTKIWEIVSELVKAWFESHLRNDRNIIIKYVKDNYEKGMTYTKSPQL
ncbi:MAG: hypothetical protein AB1779_11310 [Candidatus Thermoplasmatota archaeon]